MWAVLYWTVDGTAGQRDSGTAGQRDTGRAILYWTEAARGRWTMDAGQVDSGRDRVDRTTVLTLEY